MVTVWHRFAPLLALSAGALVPGAGFGQDTETDDARGWLGVRVEERYNCGWETTEDWKNCALVTRIREMQEDGPAARAGLLAGDRLVAIDGQDITLDNWPGLLGSIRRGTAIVFDVTRAGDPYTFRVVPAVRPADPDRVPMIGRRTIVAVSGSPESTVRVLRLNDPSGSDRVGFALTFRDTEDVGLAIEPSAVREVNGRLEVRFVRDRPIPEHQNLRRELLENLERETESAYRDFSSVLRRVGQIRARLSAREFRRGMTQLARVAMDEDDLATRFHRTFAGAEFEAVRRFSGRDGLDGLLVLRVVPGTITARVGLRPGDLLVRAGEAPMREVEDLIAAIESAAGEPLSVVWIRGGREIRNTWPRR
ncbi:PDZ domain-containing protein [Candidatus Palauibacter sp.]|uniref:PDZ domain-containing protein n=1 Tax=Candidatus Palauibacter sp. TaxID=3101350 RepID=UPI003AF3147F